MKSEKNKPAKKAAKTVAKKALKKTTGASAKKAPAKKAVKKAVAKKAAKKAVKAPAKKATKAKKQKPEELLDAPDLILDTPEEAAAEEADEQPELPAAVPQRLHKILAHAGVASRRKAEEMIVEGRVQVNGKVVSELGAKADPVRDHIRVDGKLLQGPERLRYYMLNKPRGYVTTVSDPEGRSTVMEFVAKLSAERLYPVGRLDYLSEGLLLMTNDGDLAHKLTQASSGVEKVYLVKVAGVPSDEEIEKLRSGVLIERGKIGTGGERIRTAPAEIKLAREGDNPWFEVVLIEGRNRELRKMFEEIGHHVEKIRRVGYGPLVLDVEPGKVRELDAKEVEDLRLTAEGKLKPKRQKLVLPKAKKAVPKSFEKFDKKVAGRKPAAGFNATKDFEQGDRPSYKPRRDSDGEKREFRPKREGSFGGPRKEGGFKPQRTGGFGGPRREGKPAFGAGEKRFTPGDKPRFNREGGGDKPAFKPRREGEGDRPSFRPKREGGFSGPRREGGFGGPRKEGGFKPQRTGGFGGPRREGGFGGPRPGGRPPFGGGAKPFTPKPRFDADDKPAYNREKPGFRIERADDNEKPAFRPQREGSGDRPAFNRERPAFRPKREGGFGGPRREGGFGGPRKEGFKPQRREGGFGGPRAGGRPSFGTGDKPRFTPGDKPRFNREGGDKPAFRPKRDGDFKPKREGGFGGPRKEGGSSTGWKPKKPFGQGGFGKGPKKFGGPGKKPFNRGGGKPPR